MSASRWTLFGLCLLIFGCAERTPLRASDGGPFRCRRVCTDGYPLPFIPTIPTVTYTTDTDDTEMGVLRDCCVDARGVSWTSCAWNNHVLEETFRHFEERICGGGPSVECTSVRHQAENIRRTNAESICGGGREHVPRLRLDPSCAWDARVGCTRP